MDRPICEVHTLGLTDYQVAWNLQNKYADEIASDNRPPTLLLLEHPHTYTFGRRGDAANLLWDQAELRKKGVSIHWVDRGGDVTYHGPGQLVGYPLLPLGSPSSAPLHGQSAGDVGSRVPMADYVGYIRKLEQVIISAVRNFGITAKQVEGLTGVWVEKEQIYQMNNSKNQFPIQKLAAIGVKVDVHGISRHGFALNIDPDMDYWEGIIGCGLPYPETSLAGLLDSAPEMEVVMGVVAGEFGDLFDYQISYV